MPDRIAAVKVALANRNEAKATYDEAQDELAQAVARAAADDGGWYQMEQSGLRPPEIQRLIRRAHKNQ